MKFFLFAACLASPLEFPARRLAAAKRDSGLPRWFCPKLNDWCRFQHSVFQYGRGHVPPCWFKSGGVMYCFDKKDRSYCNMEADLVRDISRC